MGMAFALGEGYEGVITMDGNGKDDPAGVARIVEALDGGWASSRARGSFEEASR